MDSTGLDLDHTDGDENDVDDELDHDEAENLLADETIEQKTETTPLVVVCWKKCDLLFIDFLNSQTTGIKK